MKYEPFMEITNVYTLYYYEKEKKRKGKQDDFVTIMLHGDNDGFFDQEFNDMMYEIIDFFTDEKIILQREISYLTYKYEPKIPNIFYKKEVKPQHSIKLLEFLEENKSNKFITSYQTNRTNKKIYGNRAELSILYYEFDKKIFARTDIPNHNFDSGKYTGPNLKMFSSSCIKEGANTEEIINQYQESENYLIDISWIMNWTHAEFKMKKDYLTIEKLADIIRPILTKYDKILEVNI